MFNSSLDICSGNSIIFAISSAAYGSLAAILIISILALLANLNANSAPTYVGLTIPLAMLKALLIISFVPIGLVKPTNLSISIWEAFSLCKYSAMSSKNATWLSPIISWSSGFILSLRKLANISSGLSNPFRGLGKPSNPDKKLLGIVFKLPEFIIPFVSR